MAYLLTEEEKRRIRQLTPRWGVEGVPKEAEAIRNFWRAWAAKHGLDPASLRSFGYWFGVSGLPLGHALPWCHPLPSACRVPAAQAYAEYLKLSADLKRRAITKAEAQSNSD